MLKSLLKSCSLFSVPKSSFCFLSSYVSLAIVIRILLNERISFPLTSVNLYVPERKDFLLQ